MRPRIFKAETMGLALSALRESYGEDAVILDTRTLPDGVEVLATGASGVPVEAATEPMRAAAEVARKPSPALLSTSEGAPHVVLVEGSLAPTHGRFAFIGPCGAGKTTLVAKLAANHVLAHGRERIGILSLDHWRPGGHRDLLRLARLLKVRFVGCDDPESASRQLAEWQDLDLVLIDTGGVPISGTGRGPRLADLSALSATPVLTVPLTLALPALRVLLRTFGPLAAEIVALTHADGAVAVRSILEELDRNGLRACWASTGPDIPDDLESADGEVMTRLLKAPQVDSGIWQAGEV